MLHSKSRYTDAIKLLDYGFNEFTKKQTAIAKGDIWGCEETEHIIEIFQKADIENKSSNISLEMLERRI